MKRPPLLNKLWPVRLRQRLLAVPGVLTLLSLLAVWLGAQPPTHEMQARVTAGSVTPALPELRAAPQPAPVLPLPAAPPPETFQLPGALAHAERVPRGWTAPAPAPDLHALGRQQTDGG